MVLPMSAEFCWALKAGLNICFCWLCHVLPPLKRVPVVEIRKWTDDADPILLCLLN